MKYLINIVIIIWIGLPLNAQFTGGAADGFVLVALANQNNTQYSGGNADGFINVELLGGNDLYEGGSSDGFALQNLFQDYIWTGTIGSGWNVTGNWSANQIPDLRHDVIIPDSSAHWPGVNAGILSIGRNPNNAQFICNSITVEPNAQMTTRINCFVTNYGNFVVKGSLFVKNTAIDAFVNKMNSFLDVQNGTITFSAN